jgi:hypothetical protein
VLDFYRVRTEPRVGAGQSGAVVAVQRTSSDLKLNPHVHAVLLDGVYQDGAELAFRALAHLTTRALAAVLEPQPKRNGASRKARAFASDESRPVADKQGRCRRPRQSSSRSGARCHEDNAPHFLS